MDLTHFDESGRAKMVDISEKERTKREAIAEGTVMMQPETLARIKAGTVAKGDVLAVAQVAGIMAAKRTPEIIPMCHTLLLTGVELAFELEAGDPASLHITATVRTVGQTGAEMEALHAVSAAALTVYDMCKAVDRGIEITGLRLLRKSGGKSGEWTRESGEE